MKSLQHVTFTLETYRPPMPQPFNVFIIYAREDAAYLEELCGQLRPLEIAGRIRVWSDQEINPGVDWQKEIVLQLDTADIILILVSSAYYNSVYIHEKELKYAFARHERGECKVLPIIVRPCSFGDDPGISRLQVLPTDAKPVTDTKYWPERDAAWLDVVSGLKRTLDKLQATEAGSDTQRVQEVAYNKDQQKAGQNIQKTGSFPWIRYALITGGALFLLLLVWQGFNMFGARKATQEAGMLPNKDNSNAELSDFKFKYPMERVLGATFQMGSPTTEQGRYEDECQHTVSIKPFSIGCYEVTQAQWKSVMGSNPAKFQNCEDCPVEQVSWNDVQDFINKLNQKTGKTYRLPTESEWEYAARGGQKRTTYHPYPGGQVIETAGWYKENAGAKTRQVGKKAPNELGLYDMSGNVWEWCQDLYKAYPNCSSNAKEGQQYQYIMRGGCWADEARTCRVSNRGYSEQDKRDDALGFRLASD
ncbi:MAG: SUMF1/EgtB/PvdO family nonheme iron enzyme [Bacteroidota bacterium]